MNYKEFKNKYVIKGKLIVITGLHIGGGIIEGDNDAPFIKNRSGEYYIPGSSFKGYLRSKVEGFLVGEPFGLHLNGDILNEADVLAIFGYTKLEKEKDEKIKQRLKKLLGDIDNFKSKIYIPDLIISSENKVKKSTRDGIRISRETGAVVKSAKFNYDILEKDTTFEFEMILENIEDYQIELIMLGLRDIMSEDLFGGKLSSGIGKCKLKLTECNYIDVDDKKALEKYIFDNKLQKKNIEELKKIKKISM